MKLGAQVAEHNHPVRRSWPWLIAAFVLCPCHVPILLAVLGTGVLGGGLARNQWLVILVLGVAFVVLLARGLGQRRDPACAACREAEGRT